MNDLERMLKELEIRAPLSALQHPTEYTTPGEVLLPEWDGDRGIRKGYLESIYIYKCVDKISSSLARQPWRAGKNPDDPTTYSKSGPLSDMLGPPPGGPNPAWTPTMLWKYAISQYLLLGKFAWQVERNNRGKIVALWPLQAQHLKPIPASGNRAKGYFVGFKYGDREKIFRPDEIIYCWKPSLADPRQPESLLEVAKLEVSILQLANSYDYSLLKNNAVPATIVTHERFAEESMRAAFRKQWERTFAGSSNAGKTLFIEADPDYTSDGSSSNNVGSKISVNRLGLDANEMQSGTHKVSVIQDICVAFGTPLSVLGDSTRSKFQNFDMDYKNWWMETLVPLAGEMADLINVHLAPSLGTDIGWFDLTNVRALNPENIIQPADVVALVAAGIALPDEARDMLGLPPLREVDKTNQELKPLQIELPSASPSQGAPPDKPLPAKKPAPTRASVKAWERLLRGTIERVLTEQQKVIAERSSSRKGKNAELRALLDDSWWTSKLETELGAVFDVMAGFMELPVDISHRIALRLVEDSGFRLQAAQSVEDAYSDIEQRASTLSRSEIAALETIPADYLLVLLEAVGQGKMEPSKALTLVEEL